MSNSLHSLRIKVGAALTTLPEELKPHKKVGDIYRQRNQMIETGKAVDWALAEQAWHEITLYLI